MAVEGFAGMARRPVAVVGMVAGAAWVVAAVPAPVFRAPAGWVWAAGAGGLGYHSGCISASFMLPHCQAKMRAIDNSMTMTSLLVSMRSCVLGGGRFGVPVSPCAISVRTKARSAPVPQARAQEV